MKPNGSPQKPPGVSYSDAQGHLAHAPKGDSPTLGTAHSDLLIRAYSRPQSGRQLVAARMLAGITQEELASLAGLHVNSVRYLERQNYITTAHSSQRVTEAMAVRGVLFFSMPSCGVRLRHDGEFT
jgi:DNA-binding XRE family transcriptional regulator